MKQQFVVTKTHFLHKTENKKPDICLMYQYVSMLCVDENIKTGNFCCGHKILTEGVLVAHKCLVMWESHLDGSWWLCQTAVNELYR
jgi:hypothetical protein